MLLFIFILFFYFLIMQNTQWVIFINCNAIMKGNLFIDRNEI